MRTSREDHEDLMRRSLVGRHLYHLVNDAIERRSMSKREELESLLHLGSIVYGLSCQLFRLVERPVDE